MHLLVVEDDDIVRMLMVEVLEELGYKIIEAEDARTALEILASDKPLDLMMTDVGLPDISGKELAAKARDIRHELPILFASGYADSFQVPDGMHLIGKPFTMDQLRDKLTSILAPS
ncbi:response regulator [Pseudomonas capeferrum]|uniref:response regulator n=1 Tax=Pseudomonas capeferrum TaxID=1495066 RepID=UPI0015E45CED|nr:response regulator [Pseudomonas capeferrum]MBA1200307.1 response regulator [Pseudomonas capeferrum]